MAAPKALVLDTRQIDALADALAGLTAEQVARLEVETVNEVVHRTYDLARDRMIANINLTDPYLRRRMRVDEANKSRPEASITATGRGTTLGRFDAKPQIRRAVSDRSRLKGNARLGIAIGDRQLGVKVQVTRGAAKEFANGFLLPLRRGSEEGGNGFGVFARTRQGLIKHRYGPSVYQLFAYQADRVGEETLDDMQETLLRKVDEKLEKEFSK